MKRLVLLANLLLFLGVSVYAQTLPDERRVSYASVNKPLKIVLQDLSTVSEINIAFSESRIPAEQPITISANQEPLGAILNSILDDFQLGYQIVGNQIVIVRDRLHDAKSRPTISGYIKDKSSGENLVAASVFLYDKSLGTTTNEDGFYSFTLNKGTQRIFFTYLGYEQEVLELFLRQDTTFNIYLEPDALLNEVLIVDNLILQQEESTATGFSLYKDQINNSSSLGGESDIIRLVNNLPGVTSGSDGFGGLNIRGGSSDQNLILLDGVPVYNSGHALGVFSVFNPHIVKSARLINGNFPAQYGGRLSSVLDVHTRDGSTKKFGGSFGISIIAAKASLEGPIGNNGSSYIFSFRRTFLDPWLSALSKSNYNNEDKVGSTQYYFYDVNGKVNLALGEKTRLSLSSYAGRDKYDNDVSFDDENNGITTGELDQTNWNWGNRIASAKLSMQHNRKAFSRFLAYYSKFDFESFDHSYFSQLNKSDTTLIYSGNLFLSGVRDYGARYDFEFIPTPTHLFRLGGGAILHRFNPGLIAANQSNNAIEVGETITPEILKSMITEPEIDGQEYFAYISDQISLGKSFIIDLGVHNSFIQSATKNYVNVQPRLSLLAQSESTFFKIGASKMTQYLHLLNNSEFGFPSDVWIPTTDILEPEQSWIYSASLGFNSSGGFRLGTSAYYKDIENITSLKEGELLTIDEERVWDGAVPIGDGTAYGVEAYFSKVTGKTTWNANYALSWSNRTFLDLNNAEEFPFAYDRTHNFKFSFFHRIAENTEFVLNWQYATGNPITYPSGDIQIQNDAQGNAFLAVIFPGKNNRRLPEFMRLDVSFNFYSKYKWGRTKLSIGVYNAFNRSNPFYIDVERNSDLNDPGFEIKEYSIFPVFPVLSYNLSF